MADPLKFPGVLDLVALELGRDAAALIEVLRQDASRAEELGEELAASPLARVRLELAEPIHVASGEAPLLAAPADLEMKHLRTLLKRQASDPGIPLGPVCLQANSSLLGHLKDLVRKRVRPAVDGARTGGGHTSQLVSQLLPQSSNHTRVEACLDDVVESLSVHEPFVPSFLAVVSNPANLPLLEDSVSAARVALAVLGEYQRFPSDEERRRAFLELGTAALLQDLSVMVEPDTLPEDHADRSRQWVQQLDLGVAVATLVRDHHMTRTSRGRPVLQSKRKVSEPLRVLVVVNSFLELAGKKGPEGGYEAIKGLNHLATGGFVDKAAVDILSRLFLPKVKSTILARANKIATHCPLGPTTPVLWPLTGDKTPSVFICNRHDCDQLSEQINYLAQNIPFELDGEEITTIRKGNYYVCPFLSGRLKELYTLISQRNRSAGKA